MAIEEFGDWMVEHAILISFLGLIVWILLIVGGVWVYHSLAHFFKSQYFGGRFQTEYRLFFSSFALLHDSRESWSHTNLNKNILIKLKYFSEDFFYF